MGLVASMPWMTGPNNTPRSMSAGGDRVHRVDRSAWRRHQYRTRRPQQQSGADLRDVLDRVVLAEHMPGVVVNEAHAPYCPSSEDSAARSACSGSSGSVAERQPMNLSGLTSRAPSSSTSRPRAQS
jgi:hypothetical protein